MAEPKPWEPKANREQTRETVLKYRNQSNLWDDKDDELKELEKHAQYHRIPFARSDEHQDNAIMSAFKQFGEGWAEGFSANIYEGGDEPESTPEAIARNLGHLAGFVGYIPGGKFSKTIKAINQLTRGSSVPMYAANKVTTMAGKALNPIVKQSTPGIAKLFSETSITGDAFRGAMHLGVASTVADWRGAVEEGFPRAMESFGYGSLFGGGFRALGSMPGFGKVLSADQIGANGRPILSKLQAGQKVDLAMKASIGAIAQNTGSWDADLPDQMYNFALGAFFGYGETPLQTRISKQAIAEAFKEGHTIQGNPDPELNPKWDSWTKFQRDAVKKDFDTVFGTDTQSRVLAYKIAKKSMDNGEITMKDIIEMNEGYREGKEIGPSGEIYEKMTPKEIKKVQEFVKENPNLEDYQDLDMHINDINELPGRISGENGYVEQFIRPQMKTNKDFNLFDRVNESLKINKKWDSLHKDTEGVRVPKKGALKEMYKYLYDTYGKPVTESEKDWWRNWAEQTRKKRPVLQVYSSNGEFRFIDDRGANVLGSKKELAFEPPRIEDVYGAVWVNNKEQLGPVPTKPFYSIFNHYVRNGKEYEINDVMRLQADIAAEITKRTGNKLGEYAINKEAKEKAEAYNRQQKTLVMEKMNEMNYYYAGGKGDKNAMYFVQKHPFLESGEGLQAQLKMVKDAFKAAGKGEGFDKYVAYNKKKFALNNYQMKQKGIAEDYWVESFVSNAMYEVHNNLNYNINRQQMGAGLRKVLGEGYINSAKAFNKRAQIWFNTGLSTNEGYAASFLKNFSKDGQFGKVDVVPLKNGKFKLGSFNDDVKDSKLTKRPNLERPESFDGGIPALPEFIYALNKSAGISNEGNVNKSFIVSPSERYGALLGKYMFFEASPKLQAMMRKKGIHAIAPKSALKQMGDREFGRLVKPGEEYAQSVEFGNAEYMDAMTKFMQKSGMQMTPATEKQGPEWKSRIGEIFFPKDKRGQGFGTEFFRLFEKKARADGKDFITIDAIGGNKDFSNVNFWKKMGFTYDTRDIRKKNGKLNFEIMFGPDDPVLNKDIIGAKNIRRIPMIKVLKPTRAKAKGLEYEGPTYDIPISDVRTILSEITDSHMLDGARFPKQMLSTIGHYGKTPTDPEVVKSMADQLIGESVAGTKEANKNFENHRKNPNEVSEKWIMDNLESVSLSNITKALLDTNNEPLAAKLYKKILKMNTEIENSQANDAEMSREEYIASNKQNVEFNSMMERNMALYPEQNLGPLLHKFSRDRRFVALRNYIVHRASRPRIENSGTARMRPWDAGMQLDPILSQLNKNQDIFFLDNNWKNKQIHDSFFKGGSEKLGNVWKEFQKGKKGRYRDDLPRVEDILESTIMRVPMDSQSGAHVLKFGGFTGIRGSGILLHGRTMEALGGADLDGDKAFIFLGGEKGIHKDWKEIYRGQKDEFTVKNKKGEQETLPAKTEEARGKFVKENQEVKSYGESPFAQYDPVWRGFMSEAAAEGRDTLGGAVTARQAFLGAYDAIRMSGKKQHFGESTFIAGKFMPKVMEDGAYYYPIDLVNKEGKRSGYYYVKMESTLDAKRLQKFKELSRAAINLGADPMDEAGIVGLPKIKDELLKTLFDFKVVKSFQKRGDKKIQFTESPGYTKMMKAGKMEDHKRYGLHADFARANNVLYGKNFKTGRKWSLNQIQEGINGITWMPKESQNSLLPFLSRQIKGVVFEDNLLRRVDGQVLREVYENNRQGVGKDKELLELFERTSMMSRQGKLLENVIRDELFTQGGRIKLARNKERFWEMFTKRWYPQYVHQFELGKNAKLMQKDFYEMGEIPYHMINTFFSKGKNTTFRERMEYLETKANTAEDFLVNDLSDMAGLSYILKVKEKGNISKDRFQAINKLVEKVKNDSYWIKQARKEALEDLESQVFSKEQLEQVDKLGLSELIKKDKIKTGDDQVSSDNKILKHKQKLKSNDEKKLYDALLLGTFNRADLPKLKELQTKFKNGEKMTGPELWAKNTLEKHAQNTSLLRLGFNSKAVSDGSLRDYWKEYNKFFRKIKNHDIKEQEFIIENSKIKENTEKFEKVTEFKDELGKEKKGSIIESSELSSSDRKFLDEIEPFIGLHKGKLTGEAKEIFFDMKGHLKHYHNLDSTNLNGLFRDLFKKNINQANLADFRVLNEYFKDMRTGSAWTQMWDKLMGKNPSKDLPDIKRKYWSIFPRAINRDMLRYPAMVQWRKDIGPYKDRFDNSIMGRVVRPTAVIGDIQNYAHKSSEFAIQQSEIAINDIRDELAPFVQALPEGDKLHKAAVSLRERQMKHLIAEAEGYDGKLLNHKQMAYEANYQEIKPILDQLKGKNYTVPKKDGAIVMTGEQVIKEINGIYTKQNRIVEKWINGDSDYVKVWLDKTLDKKGRVTWEGLDKLRNDFIAYSREQFRKGNRYDISKFGVHGMNEISKRILLSLTPKGKDRNGVPIRNTKNLLRYQKQLQFNSGKTPLWNAEAYFPHIAFDRGKVSENLTKSIQKVFEDTKLTQKEKNEYINKLIYQSKAMTGDWVAKDSLQGNYDEMSKAYKDIASAQIRKQKRKDRFVDSGPTFTKPHSQHERDAHMSGWSREPEAYEGYMKNISDSFYKQIMQILSRTHINQFKQKFFKQSKDSDLTDRWESFLNLYTQSAMGHPIEIPMDVVNDPKMKLSLTPYKWWADSNVRNRIDSIRKTFGLGRKALEGYNLDEATIDQLTGTHQSALQKWGSLEAKWQMASLLAHPKSSITNLYGGTIHTAIGAGIQNLRNARNIDYLKANVNPNWRSLRDVDSWVEKLGVVEEYLIHEAGLNRKIRSQRFDDFIKDATKRIARDPEYKDSNLYQLSKKYKLTDSMWNTASSFMRRPERTLRRDAFMAHYLQARENFKGAIRDFDHPFLIEMGKRGVKGTQFLYSAPFRPMWTNSTLGRVFSRFQLWSWNSVRFRNDVIREARIRGIQQGTPEFERAKRMMTADLYMKAMAGLFTYSLFDNALPAPYNWFQDTADWLMGDEKERERAFYGSPIGPASIVQPPIFRFLTPTFEGMVNGDWSQMTDYYAYTALPFGRLIKDVVGPGGIVENPFYTVEKMTGMPLIAGSRKIQEMKEGGQGRSPYSNLLEDDEA